MAAMTRMAGIAVLLGGAIAIGLLATSPSTTSAEPLNASVSDLYAEMPLDRPVRVTAAVTRVMDDYEADSGNTYQQFRVGDGDRTVKVFCGTRSGRVDVSAGDRVLVPGTFQEYYGTYEVYTRCANVRILQRAESADPR